jgi:cellobiose-specific phosphotransferase system component IIA
MRKFVTIAAASLLVLPLAACAGEAESDAEDAVEAVEEAAGDAAEAVEETAEDATQAAEETMDNVAADDDDRTLGGGRNAD